MPHTVTVYYVNTYKIHNIQFNYWHRVCAISNMSSSN